MGCCACSGEWGTQDWKVWSDHPILNDYRVVKDLGEGAFAQVVLAKHKTIPNKAAALKIVFMSNPDDENDNHRLIMRKEAEFLMMLDHPNIVTCEEVVENEKQMVMVLENLRGGQLLDMLHYIGNEGKTQVEYTEEQAADLFRQVAEGVACLHEYGIMHRDLKPENLMFAVPRAAAAAAGMIPRVKIIDLGLAAMYNVDTPITGGLGSVGFIAPEILKDQVHTPAMDIFGMGVVLFIMLVGRKPFDVKETENLTYANIGLEGAPGLKDSRWLSLSDDAKNLVLRMLDYNPKTRITAKKVLEHPWLNEGEQPKRPHRPLHADVARGAANVASMRRLRNMVHGIVAMKHVSKAMHTKNTDKELHKQIKLHRSRAESTRGYRGDASGRGISRVESMMLKIEARAAQKRHDAGRTVDPAADVSVHYSTYTDASTRGGRAFDSVRSGRLFTGSAFSVGTVGSDNGSVHMYGSVRNGSAYRPAPLKKSSTAINLSEMAPDLRDFNEDDPTPSAGFSRGQVWQRMSTTLRDLVVDASSVHSKQTNSSGSLEGSTKMTKEGSTRLKKSASGLFKRLSMRGAWGGASMESQPSTEGANEASPGWPASAVSGDRSLSGVAEVPEVLSTDPSRSDPSRSVRVLKPLKEVDAVHERGSFDLRPKLQEASLLGTPPGGGSAVPPTSSVSAQTPAGEPAKPPGSEIAPPPASSVSADPRRLRTEGGFPAAAVTVPGETSGAAEPGSASALKASRRSFDGLLAVRKVQRAGPVTDSPSARRYSIDGRRPVPALDAADSPAPAKLIFPTGDLPIGDLPRKDGKENLKTQ